MQCITLNVDWTAKKTERLQSLDKLSLFIRTTDKNKL
jgi:hypothetical protein